MGILERLDERARRSPDARLFTFLDDDGRVVETLDARAALHAAAAIAELLRKSGLSAGDRAVLVYPPGLDFVRALLGCLYGGVIPVPVYPPNPVDPAPSLAGFVHVAFDSGAKAALTSRSYARARQLGRLRGWVGRKEGSWPELEWIKTDAASISRSPRVAPHAASPDDTALLQYTSGSTSAPRGVELTHGNLLHQLAFNRRALELGESSKMLAWLPPYHDFGLISGILSAVAGNGELVMLSPLSFIRRPLIWLESISQQRATHTAAPNFAFELVTRKSTPEERARLDLSCLRVVMSAAEPIRGETVDAFLSAFAPSGLAASTFCPAYGLAEHTVGVTVGGKARARLSRDALERDKTAIGATNDAELVELIGCGAVADDITVRIVDPETLTALAEGRVGEIWVDSPSKARGYWGAPGPTRELLEAKLATDDGHAYLRTGDLGFLRGGELYVCGRLKDILIIRGRNIYPQDLEDTVQAASPLVRPGCVAAFGVEREGEERLVVVAECRDRPSRPDQHAALASAVEVIARAVLGRHQVQLAELVWVEPKSIPKTSSGKIQRRRAKAELAGGTLSVVDRARPETHVTPIAIVAHSAEQLPPPEAAPLEGLAAAERRIWELLRERPALTLGAEVAADVPFRELGLDSVSSVELSARLGELWGRSLPATLLFEYPTVAAVARHLLGVEAPASQAAPLFAPDEPIAIVSLACRLPGGVSTPEALWELFDEGREVIGPFPERWRDLAVHDPNPESAGKSYVARGGFIDDVDAFDAAFFRISPREAANMDPQQRLALELAWEALERAGIPPDRLEESLTGVFLGASGSDYGPTTLESFDGYRATGAMASVLSGRISHVLGLEGPALTVDTACSSSLVAIHLACAALRRGECRLALAGGVQVMASPAAFVEFSRMRGLAPDGRCKSFGAGADGVVWSEGCGVTVLMRLSDALAEGAPILAVIRGSAVNHDGKSQGLTVPSRRAQERVLAQALVASRLSAAELDYVEAHGTGTKLGDPIEANALARVLGQGRGDRPLLLGASKSNLGHAQAAAGVIGLMKVVLSLQAQRLPKTLHADPPSPHVDWATSGLELVSTPRVWPRGERVRRAGVSSFGLSGTNAHLILEEAPAREHFDRERAARDRPLLLSAPEHAGVVEQAKRLAGWLDAHPEAELADVLYSASRRAHPRGSRAAVLADDVDDLRRSLVRLALGEPDPAIVARRKVPDRPGGLAFMFGGTLPKTALGLLVLDGPFRDALEEISSLTSPELERPLLPLLDAADTRLERSTFAEPAIFALGVALFRHWSALGVRPELVLGYGAGELAAAVAAGLLSLADGCKLACARGRMFESAGRDGLMIALDVAEAELDLAAGLELIAVNGPRRTIVRGPKALVESFAERWRARDRAVVVLGPAPAAFSSAALERFRAVVEAIRFSAPRLLVPPELTSLEHWRSQPASVIHFARGMTELHARGARSFLDLGLGGALSGLAAGLALEGASFVDGKGPSFAGALAALFTGGHAIDWLRSFSDTGAQLVQLPTYPFQRERFWIEAKATAVVSAKATERRLSFSEHPSLRDHRLGAHAVASVTTLLELAREAAGAGCEVIEARLVRPLLLDDAADPVSIAIDGEKVEIGDAAGVVARAKIRRAPSASTSVSLSELSARLRPGTPAALHAALSAAGVSLSCAPYLTHVALGEGESLLSFEALDADAFALLDGAVLALAAASDSAERPRIPTAVASYGCEARPSKLRFWACRTSAPSAPEVVGDVRILDLSGKVIGALTGLRLEPIDPVRAIEVAWASDPRRSLAPSTPLGLSGPIAISGASAPLVTAISRALDVTSDTTARSRLHLVAGPEKAALAALWAAHQSAPAQLERFIIATHEPLSPEARRFVEGLLAHRRAKNLPAEHQIFRWQKGAPSPRPVVELSPPKPRPELGPDLKSTLREEAARVLGLRSASEVPLDRPLVDLGFDSIMAVELRDALSRRLGRKIEPTVVYDHPTIAALAAYLGGTEAQRPTAGVALSATDEPIAVVGMACRFPGGAVDPKGYWRLLRDGVDAVREVPKDRWDVDALYDPDPDAPGKMNTRNGAFLEGVDRFDAPFFSISAREAAEMDPQQRLLLELAWESLEHAGIKAGALMGTKTGVYVGLLSNEYLGLSELGQLSGHAISGNVASIASGRISYVLGAQGPSLTVDTGCSSSLVTIHLACASLRSGESDVALAGGASLILTPTIFVGFSRLRGLAADGRCKTFSAGADGVGWGEGAGMVVLKRLKDALAANDHILGVIRGTAVNQDGRSAGLTAPNGPSQVSVIRAALAQAGLTPADVDYVEAHGTGTTLGDPIELSSLGVAYGKDRAQPLLVGSVKTNLGHTQAAAGIAGFVKVLLSLEHETIPPHLHFSAPTPHVEWSGLGVEVPAGARPWPRRKDKPRRAGISSFGLSGTNAHVIVEEPPAPATHEMAAATRAPLLLSAIDEPSLRLQGASWAEWLADQGGTASSEVIRTAALHRVQHPSRAAVLGGGGVEALRALAAGKTHPKLVTGKVAERGKVVFVFPGQGGQWPAMGKQLLAESEVFAEAITRCDSAIAKIAGWSVRDVLTGAAPLEKEEIIHPALFAMSLGLAAVWRALGVEPDAVVGQSQGELAAAVVSGALSLEDGARAIVLRARRIASMAGVGGMTAVELPAAEVEPRLAEWGGALSVAMVSSPNACVVGGPVAKLVELERVFAAEDILAKRIAMDYASHCALVEPLLPGLREDLAALRPRAAPVPLYSTVDGAVVAGELLDAEYWCRNLRRPGRLDLAGERLRADGHGVFIELSPHPLLVAPLSSADPDKRSVVTGSLRKNDGGLDAIEGALAKLHVAGHAVDWRKQLADPDGPRAELPSYVFKRERHWVEAKSTRSDVVAAGLSAADHPLIGATTTLADSHGLLATGRVSLPAVPWLADHAVFSTVLFPGSGFLDLALAASAAVEGRIASLTVLVPLALPEREAVRLQVTVAGPDARGRRALSIHSRPEAAAAERAWVLHAQGLLEEDGPAPVTSSAALASWPPAGAEPIALDDFYPRLLATGASYGPTFRGLVEAWRLGERAFGRVVLPETAGSTDGYLLHPALLDAAMHTIALASPTKDAEGVWLPVEWADVRLYARGARELLVEVELEQGELADQATARLLLCDRAGKTVACFGAVGLRRARAEELKGSLNFGLQHLYKVDWRPVAVPQRSGSALDDELVIGEGEVGLLLDRASLPALTALPEQNGHGVPVPQRVWIDATGVADASDDLATRTRARTWQVLQSLQTWLADDRWATSELICVTRGAIGEGADDLAHAPLWGLLRTAKNEHPDRNIRLLDLGKEATTAGRLRRLAAIENESEVAQRGTTALVPRLTPAAIEVGTPRPLATGTVLITGGTGELGRAVARHLIEGHGAKHLVLVSRQGASAPGVAEWIRSLPSSAAVRVEACDIGDRAALTRLIDASQPALSAVFHLAGVIEDGVVTRMTEAQLDKVLRPKVDGALNLHLATKDRALSHFVLFGSVAGTIGTGGQANYAAANTFLDALASHRRDLGLVATSLAWGFWASSGVGMTATLSGADIARLRRQGMIPLSATDGLRLLDDTLAGPAADWVPVGIDLSRVERTVAAGVPVPPVLRGLVRARLRQVDASGEDASALRNRLSALSADNRLSALREIVQREVASVLGLSGGESLEAATPFRDLGFDSLMAVELRNRLSTLAGTTLPSTLALNFPTVEALSKKLCDDYFATKLEASKSRKALRDGDIDRALQQLRDAGLVERLGASGMLEPVVEFLTELQTQHATASVEAVSGDQALDIARTMDAESIEAKLAKILGS